MNYLIPFRFIQLNLTRIVKYLILTTHQSENNHYLYNRQANYNISTKRVQKKIQLVLFLKKK